jgi:cardiolipin synthase
VKQQAPEVDTPWSDETLLYDGDAFFDHVLRDINLAERSIIFETYIYRDDVIGHRVAQALVRAVARGVNVRLIVDGIGASGWFEKNAPLLESEGVRVRIYHPVIFANLWSRIKIDLGIMTPPKSFEKLRGSVLVSLFNRRDHRKMCVIDDRVAYVGSMNVTSDHCASIVGDLAWRDTALRVEGGAIDEILTAFNAVWDRCHDAHARPRWRDRITRMPTTRAPVSRYIRFNYTARLRKQTYRNLIRRIAKARHRVWITNPYFAPAGTLLRALAKASANGADVRILVPRNSDVFFMPWVATAYYTIVLKGGAKIYEYLPRMLHAKTAVIDQWAMVGSSNFNRRSLVHDFEVDLVLARAETREELVQTFLKDLELSEQVQAARGGLTAFLGRLLSRLLKNWI